MRNVLGVMAASFLAIVAGQAEAVGLLYSGDLAIQIAGIDVSIPGAGPATVNGSGGGGHINSLTLFSGAFATTGLVVPVTDPAVIPIAGIKVTAANGLGVFSGAPLAGVMQLAGTAKVCLFAPCSAAVANMNVPLAPVGFGGSAQATAAVNLTVIGAPWTTGTVAIGTVTAMGGASPVSNTGATSGMLSLVTPVFLSTNTPLAVIPAFGFLDLHFAVPEPGTFVLLGSGVAGFAAFGRIRRNRK